jgi:hypothetical protein
MIHIHSHVYNLNIQLFAGFPDNFFRHLCNIPEQYIPAILRRKKAFLVLFHSKIKDINALFAK